MPSKTRRVVMIAACVVLMGIAIAVVGPARKFFAQQAALQAKESFQQAIADQVKKLGGTVGFAMPVQQGMFEFREIDSVTLVSAAPDDDLVVRLSKQSGIKRMNLQQAKVNDSIAPHLAAMTNLEWLSLAKTRVGDPTVVGLVGLSRLKTLSLRGTSLTDNAVDALATLGNLTNLDISDTDVTEAGAGKLTRLASLRTLTLDEQCITPELVETWASVKQLEMLEVRIPKGLGKPTKDILAGKLTVQVEGVNADGQRLWYADIPWEDTLAGVVDIVTNEVQLTEEEAQLLLDAIRTHDHSRQPNRRQAPRQRSDGDEIPSFEEFVQALNKTKLRSKNMRLFARNKFTKADASKMLEVVRASLLDPQRSRLVVSGTFLMSHYAIDDERVRDQLDQWLKDRNIRGKIMYAFDPWSFDPDEKWETSEELAEFAVPRLLACADDATESEATTLSDVLGHLAQDHPRYTPQVLELFVRWIRECKGVGNLYDHLQTIIEKNPGAVLQILPELRRIYAESPLAGDQRVLDPWTAYHRERLIIAICNVARFSPASKDVAKEYLERLRRGNVAVVSFDFREAFATLAVSNDTQTTADIVRELLEIYGGADRNAAAVASNILADVSRAIRSRRFPMNS